MRGQQWICLSFTSFSGTHWWYSNKSRIDELFAYSLHWKEHIYHRRISWNFQSILGRGLIPGRQENDRARQSVFCTALNPFGQDTEEEPVVLISTQGHVEEQLANTAAATTAAAAAWEQRATWESRTRVRDDMKHAMEVERASRKLVLATSEAEADAHLTGRKTLTNTDTKEIERIKIGSNKICIREDLAKEKRVFSKETSHAISAMGSVNHRFNAHHAFTTFLKAHFFAIAVSYKSSTRTPTGLKKPSGSWKHHSVHLRFPREVANAARIHGSNITSRLETRYGVLQKAVENLCKSGTDGKMMRLTGNLSLSITGRMLGFDTWITVYISVPTTMRRNSTDKEICTNFAYAVLTKTDRHHLYRRDQGTGKRKSNWKIYNRRKENNQLLLSQ